MSSGSITYRTLYECKEKKAKILPEYITEKMYEFNITLLQSNNQLFKHMPVLLLILSVLGTVKAEDYTIHVLRHKRILMK